jgi:NADH-quinone oxidoreductase subunit M
MTSVPLLSLVVFLPLAGAVGAALLPRVAGWGWALTVSLADFALALYLLTQYNSAASGFQFAESVPWLPDAGITYALGLDGVNVLLIGLNALLTAVAVGASWQVPRTNVRSREYFALMMLLSCGMQGVFLATNLFLFYVFWEVMLVPAYLLVGMFGGPRRTYAAIKFVLYTAAGSLLMLVGIIVLGAVTSGATHGYTLDLPALLAAGVPAGAQLWLFLAFAAAFAIKSALFPFHSWVPDTYSQAPVAVVALIAGVMAKTGAYGFLRFCLPLFPVALHTTVAGLTVAQWVGLLSVVGILYFAVQALVAQDMQRLLAYVSISHMGVILLGIFALNAQGSEGAILQMVNHGIIIAALFLIAGAVESRTGTRRLAEFGGLASRVPALASVFLIVSLAALGLPGLNSFAGEFLAFLGAFRANIVLGTLGTAVVIPAAWYMLRFFQGVMDGPLPDRGPVAAALTPSTAPGRAARTRRGGVLEARTALVDLRLGEFLVLAPLVVLIIVLGIAPGMLTSRIVGPDGDVTSGSAAPAHSVVAHRALAVITAPGDAPLSPTFGGGGDRADVGAQPAVPRASTDLDASADTSVRHLTEEAGR